MHMGNELLTLPVAGALAACAAAGIAAAAARARRDLDERRAPLLGVLGAFVFAAQMVNFPVLPGTSGHFVGAALLAILLGPHAAALGMASIVIVQCLVFQDGGLLALGANLVNMALVGPYAAWAVYRLVAPRGAPVSRVRLYAASFLAALASILAGAALVPIEVAAADVSRVPLPLFLGTMLGIHALIGAAEGILTFAVLAALARMRPDLLPGAPAGAGGLPLRAVALSIVVTALLVAGFLSLAASGSPDGLDSTIERTKAVDSEKPNPAAEAAEHAGTSIALLPDYSGPGGAWYWTTVAGLLGALLVLGVAAAAGRTLRGTRNRRSTPMNADP
jgi:cobalt/nickel transport system permease protein